MAREVRFRERAVQDLELIWQHIARESETYATAVTARIVSAAEDLAEYPHIGHRVEQIGRADLREIAVYPYRVFYVVQPETIWILAITHGARDLRQPFFDRL